MLKKTNFTFLHFAILNPCLSVSSFHPLFMFFENVSSVCEMPIRSDVRIYNGVHTSRWTAKPIKSVHLGIVSYPFQLSPHFFDADADRSHESSHDGCIPKMLSRPRSRVSDRHLRKSIRPHLVSPLQLSIYFWWFQLPTPGFLLIFSLFTTEAEVGVSLRGDTTGSRFSFSGFFLALDSCSSWAPRIF